MMVRHMFIEKIVICKLFGTGLDHVEVYKSAFLEDVDCYKCQEKYCIFKTISRVTFERHRQRVHQEKYDAETGKTVEVFKCEVCSQELAERCYLKQHYKAKHRDDYINRFFEDPEYFYCSICSKEFTNYHCLDRHMSFHHSDK
uniref:C2H2-type domain-containing protein n=1 Tax=Strongyloides papillosus TaxID=174720 RepID=A0A0N5BB55_STREA